MSQDRGFCRVVVLGRDDRAVGCGFICGTGQVMTCTHVVRSARGEAGGGDRLAAVVPGQIVTVIFPTAPGHRTDLRVVVAHAEGEGLLGDIALLELCEDNVFPPDFRIAATALANVDRRLSIAGVGISAALGDVQIIGPTGEYSGLNRVFVRAEGQDSEVAFEGGCSGTAVYDDRFGLVGMAAERQAERTGFIIPVQLLRHVWRLADTPVGPEGAASSIAGDAYRASFVGPPFGHDVFLSYARGDLDAPDIRLADTIAEIEGVIHRGDACGTALTTAIRDSDDAGLSAGDAAAVRASALFLAFVSRSYLASASCRAEIDAFLAQAHADGRTAAHVVICLVEAVPTDGTIAWPQQLLDGGRPPSSARMLPGGTNAYRARQEAIQGLVGELRVKLKALAGQMEATRPPVAVLEPSGQLYLQSHRDPTGWLRAKTDLEDDQFVVIPQPMQADASGIAEQVRQDDDRVRMLYAADGLVLIRTAADDPTGLQATLGWGALQRLKKLGRPLGWVLLNWVDDDGPALPRNLPLRCISMRDPDWRQKLRRELQLGA